MLNRRSLITGLISLVAAPAIVRVGSLMPVKVMVEFEPVTGVGWSGYRALLEEAHRAMYPPTFYADLGAFGTAAMFNGEYVPLRDWPPTDPS
jgi:hypothetical protein